MKKIMFNDRYGLTKAVLSGRKTQTRRIIKLDSIDFYSMENAYRDIHWTAIEKSAIARWAKYKIGEVVAVAQAYDDFVNDEYNHTLFPDGAGWTNKIFVRADLMPHRIRITNVRVEQLQDISDEDCIKEGIMYDRTDLEYQSDDVFDYFGNDGDAFDSAREAFASLIDNVSGKGTFESNQFVFVYDFELVK